ncbi:hypothetical protein ACS0TY_005302 [Phlomoides rotata]
MEYENQTSNSNAASPYIYMTAPTSPKEYNRNNSMEFYYSAPASPQWKGVHAFKMNDDDPGSNLDDFEFETSKRFIDPLHSETHSSPVGREKHRERGDSLPGMAFADELFLNGLVMPLKLPPRLQSESDFTSFSQKSPVASPRTVCRIPFACNSSWNDDFDPFMVALEKVREEKRGRNSHHRRSRSFSPFRATSKISDECCDQDDPKGNNPMQLAAPSYSGPLDFKGSVYARWVRDQTRHGLSPKSSLGFLSRQRVRPLRIEHDGSEKYVGKKSGKGEESTVQKLKGFLLRYASFGSKKTKKSSEAQKQSHFGTSSFKFKGSFRRNSKRAMAADTNTVPITYCLGYGVGSP